MAYSLQILMQEQKDFFLEGGSLEPAFRISMLKKLKLVLRENEKSIADAVYKDFRKSYFEVMENELGLVYAEISKTIKKLKKWSRPSRPFTSLTNLPGQSRVYPIPYGNVLIISPWNYPVQLALIPLVSAIAAGNTVVLKPSEIALNTAGILNKILSSTFPKHLIAVVEGGVDETTALLKQRFDKIFFTGSTAVGRIVMRAAAENLTPVTLELGGKNPTLVLPDCDIKMTAKRIVWGKFHNGGQACVSPDHIYVHESIKDAFVKEILLNIEKMFKNDAFSSEAFPRIINEVNHKRLMKLIVKNKVILGGKGDLAEKYIEPTVMLDVDTEDAIMKEEVFGPLMPIISYTDLDELMSEMKKAPSPLAFYVFSRDIRKARSLQKEFRSGGGMINDTVVHFVNDTTPFGGIGDSGMGSYHGKAGFDCFSHKKTVIKKPLWFELWVKYPPYTSGKLKLIKTILK